MLAKKPYQRIISNECEGGRSFDKDEIQKNAASDRSRVIYSSPFRRLQQKAQVFSLESNASVRSRLTHSLEVADVGRRIAQQVTNILIQNRLLDSDYVFPFITTVETACLMHDIGNPPFGHFGESAIKEWFEGHWENAAEQSFCEGKGLKKKDRDVENRLTELKGRWIKDFLHFDGNPQGLRIVTKLQWNRKEKGRFGLNLSYTQLLSFIKYTRSTQEPKGDGLKKKAGYFLSEEALVKKAKQVLGIGLGARFPLAYIMEAADDIAYCLSDIEDGIEKGIVSIGSVFEQLEDRYSEAKKLGVDEKNQRPFVPKNWRDLPKVDLQDKFFDFKVAYARFFITRAAAIYVDNHDQILAGSRQSLFEKDSTEDQDLEELKKVARKELFRSAEAENIELAGHRVIIGLLEKYDRLLGCSKSQFDLLSEPSKVKGEGLDYEWRLYNRLPNKYINAYKHQRDHGKPEGVSSEVFEWFLRAHLIVDYISGMTDRFALETYQLLHGVRVQ